MSWPWARRGGPGAEEDLPPLPPLPTDTGALLGAPLKGYYLGTVDAGRRRERPAGREAGGRPAAWLQVADGGVRLDTGNGPPLWLPRATLRGARLDRAHPGAVLGPGRIVVIAWSWGGRELETAFRGTDRVRQPKLVRDVHELLGPPPDAGTPPGPGRAGVRRPLSRVRFADPFTTPAPVAAPAPAPLEPTAEDTQPHPVVAPGAAPGSAPPPARVPAQPAPARAVPPPADPVGAERRWGETEVVEYEVVGYDDLGQPLRVRRPPPPVLAPAPAVPDRDARVPAAVDVDPLTSPLEIVRALRRRRRP